LLFAQASPDHGPPILYFPQWLGWQSHATMPIFFPLRWSLLNFFSWAVLEL
jgi:hypothetical protein